jgi:hypothetical protein
MLCIEDRPQDRRPFPGTWQEAIASAVSLSLFERGEACLLCFKCLRHRLRGHGALLVATQLIRE